MKQFVSENVELLKNFAAENRFRTTKYTAYFILLFTLGVLISSSIIELFESKLPFDVSFVQSAPDSMFLLSVVIAFDFAFIIICALVFHAMLKANPKKLAVSDRNSQLFLHIIAVGLFLSGVFFAYFVLIPFILYLLLGFNTHLAVQTMDVTKYISFCLLICFLTGMAFNVPVIRFLSTKTNYLDKKYLRANKFNIIVFAVAVLAILTSIEAFKLLFLSGAVLLLFRLAKLFPG